MEVTYRRDETLLLHTYWAKSHADLTCIRKMKSCIVKPKIDLYEEKRLLLYYGQAHGDDSLLQNKITEVPSKKNRA